MSEFAQPEQPHEQEPFPLFFFFTSFIIIAMNSTAIIIVTKIVAKFTKSPP